MPNYAYLAVEVRCPSCHSPITDRLVFQWGYCAARLEVPESLYRVGDRIRWRHCLDGRIPIWSYFREPDHTFAANVGDPEIQDLVVRDVTQFGRDQAGRLRSCPTCAEQLAGAAVDIRSGVIVRGWMYRAGEIPDDADISIRRPDGGLQARADWDGHPMEVLNDC